MEAIIKETGETVKVFRIETKRIEGTLKGAHEIFYPKELEFSCIDGDWEQRRYELAKAAMQGIISNPVTFELMQKSKHIGTNEMISLNALDVADELIKRLKGDKE